MFREIELSLLGALSQSSLDVEQNWEVLHSCCSRKENEIMHITLIYCIVSALPSFTLLSAICKAKGDLSVTAAIFCPSRKFLSKILDLILLILK